MKKVIDFSRFLVVVILIQSCSKQDFSKEELLIEQQAVNAANASQLSAKAALGKAIYFDNYFSEPQVQSCASCHIPQTGFTGLKTAPTGGFGQGFISGMAEGAFRGRFGGRIPPSAAYATFSPNFGLVPDEDEEFKGGVFWDGRATGLVGKGSPAAEQALGPLLSGVEHNNLLPIVVLNKIKNAETYLGLWDAAFGTRVINTDNEAAIFNNFNKVGEAIAAYEASTEVNQFSSKYDAYLRKETELTAQEKRGLTLFNNDAKCFRCHLSEGDANNPPLFTDFQYYNLGLAKNPLNPIYRSNPTFTDLGLGGFLASQTINNNWKNAAGNNRGKFKTPTLRNTVRTTNRAYMHNGVLGSIEEVIAFYNTRDESKARGRWGRPEIDDNIQKGWLGNLNLTQRNTQDLIAFLRTLNDGWSSPAATVRTN